MSKTKKDFSANIMAQIRKEKITMKPKIFFVLGSLLLGLGITSFILFATFFFNHAFYRLRTSGSLGFLRFGQSGFSPFWNTFPLISLLISFVAILGGVFLLKKYKISYKKNFLLLSLTVLFGAILVGLFIDLSGFNEKVSQQRFAQRGIVRDFFQQKFEGSDWLVGKIMTFDKKKQYIMIVFPDGQTIKIVWTDDALLPFGTNFEIGQKLRIIGRWQGNIFVATGIGQGRMHYKVNKGRQNDTFRF